MSTIPTFTQRPGPYKAPQAKKPIPILSDASFPALGPAPAPGSRSTKPALDFKKTVMTPQAQAQAQVQVKTPAPTIHPTHPKEKKHIFITRYGDDGPEDYDGPPEEDYDEEEEEFNADIVSTRRRGDKGIW